MSYLSSVGVLVMLEDWWDSMALLRGLRILWILKVALFMDNSVMLIVNVFFDGSVDGGIACLRGIKGM